MSRTAAEKQFTEADLAAQTEELICRKDKGLLDEIPGAYKEIDQVMANQADLVEVVYTLKQVARRLDSIAPVAVRNPASAWSIAPRIAARDEALSGGKARV